MGDLGTAGRPRSRALGGRRVLLRRNVRPAAGGGPPRPVPHVHRHVRGSGPDPRRLVRRTVAAAFHGNEAAFAAGRPPARDALPAAVRIRRVRRRRSAGRRSSRRAAVAAAARSAGMSVTLRELPGEHSWAVWRAAFPRRSHGSPPDGARTVTAADRLPDGAHTGRDACAAHPVTLGRPGRTSASGPRDPEPADRPLPRPAPRGRRRGRPSAVRLLTSASGAPTPPPTPGRPLGDPAGAGPAERRLGSRPALVALVAGQVLGHRTRARRRSRPAGPATCGPGNCPGWSSSARCPACWPSPDSRRHASPALWRRRVRLPVSIILVALVLYSGTAGDVVRLIGWLLGLRPARSSTGAGTRRDRHFSRREAGRWSRWWSR